MQFYKYSLLKYDVLGFSVKAFIFMAFFVQSMWIQKWKFAVVKIVIKAFICSYLWICVNGDKINDNGVLSIIFHNKYTSSHKVHFSTSPNDLSGLWQCASEADV